MTLYLEAQSLVVVCPDCGQRYDPAKAAKIARVRTRDGRTIKPGRVEAQDVSTAAHRYGMHHMAHFEATRRALAGWAAVPDDIMNTARALGFTYDAFGIGFRFPLSFIRLDALENTIMEMDEGPPREIARRVWRAAQAVREDHPWWRAYLHELGMGADEIARGFTVSHDNRADVLIERRAGVFALDASGPTLRGLL